MQQKHLVLTAWEWTDLFWVTVSEESLHHGKQVTQEQRNSGSHESVDSQKNGGTLLTFSSLLISLSMLRVHRIATLRFRMVLLVSAHPFWKCVHRQTQRATSPVLDNDRPGKVGRVTAICQGSFVKISPLVTLIIPLHNLFRSHGRAQSDLRDELQ